MVREVLAGFPKFSANREGETATLLVKTPWSDIDAFLLELLPELGLIGSVVTTPGAPFPQLPFLRVSQVDIEPFDKTLGPITTGTGLGETDAITHPAGGALFTIQYKTGEGDDDCPGDETTGPNINYTIDIQADVLTLPNTGLEWSADDANGNKHVSEDLQAGIVLPMIEHNAEIMNVPNPPMAAIRSTIGKINNGDFRGATEKTMLFAGASVSLGFTTQGSPVATVSYRFLERGWKTASGTAVTWLMMYRSKPNAGDQHWQDIKQLDGNDIYQSGNFNALFNLDPIDDGGDPCT